MRCIGIGDNVVDRNVNLNIMFPGGNSVNFAAYMKELGKDAAWLGTLADDEEGALIRDALTALGVDLSACTTAKGCGTERCDVRLAEGERIFIGSDRGGRERARFQIDENALAYLAGFDLIHGACYGEMDGAYHRLSKLDAILTFDFSDEDAYRTQDYLAKICPGLDIALFSDARGSEADLKTLARRCQALGAETVLITRGAAGQLLFHRGALYRGRADLVTPVDTMGAGDAFFAAFAAALTDGGYQKKGAFDAALAARALASAAAFSAKNCLRAGAFGFGAPYRNAAGATGIVQEGL
jgi:sugar/nucleoside kinase (ribokinase family)